MQCTSNMKQIGLALHNYHDVYKTFPPAYIVDEQGKPKHSWRVLILPFMNEQALYDQYDFDEPWNGPQNSQLLGKIPRLFQCPAHARHGETASPCTHCVAVVGPTTAWPGPVGRKLSDFSESDTTALVVEANDLGVAWLEPRDLSLDEAVARFTSADLSLDDGHWGRASLPSTSSDATSRLSTGRHISFPADSRRRSGRSC